MSSLASVEYGLAGVMIAACFSTIKMLWGKVAESEKKLVAEAEECKKKHEATREELSTLSVSVARLEERNVTLNAVTTHMDSLHEEMLDRITDAVGRDFSGPATEAG